MKKRLTCLLLCLVMMLSLALTACSSKSTEEAAENISSDASASAKTLTMWIVSEKEVSEETARLVNQELNNITKAKFKTQLIVKFLTEDVYEETLSQTILNYEKAKENGGASEDDSAVEETETLDNGMTIIKYPDVVPYQVDIVYIAGEDMFLDYVDNGWLYALDDELNGSSKKIKEYISGTLLSAAKLDGVTYAVPNNNVIGEYTYMLLNKELMNKYSQQGYVTLGKIDGFFNTYLFNYLKQIHLFEPDVVPVNATYEDCLGLLAHYWSVDPTNYDLLQDFSAFGHHYTDIASLSRGSVILGYDSLFENADFCADYLKLNELKFDGYFSEDSSKTAAVKFVKGDSTVLEQYEEDYYSVIVEYPTASSDDIYSNMFGVCTYSKSLDRSMQVITYLNTNEEFRNIMQYGVENKHYRMNLDEDTGKTTLERISDDYMMDIYVTGNAFLAYPEPGMSEDIWEKGKIQNRGSLVNPLLGFNVKNFAATTGAAAEELTLSKDGYNVSYTTGYSKDVLSQNSDLASWLASCDEAGNGVYLLRTSETSGQNVLYNYYVYNTLISGAQSLEVVPTPYFTLTEDKNGNEKEVLESVDFLLDYTEASNSNKEYELSVVSLYIKKTTPHNILCQNDGGEVSITERELGKLITFDFLQTKEYSIELYSDLTKTSVLKNTELMAWLLDCDEKADESKKTTTFVKTYVDAATGEQTFIFYQTGMKYITTLDFVPTGDAGELNLGFNFNVIEEKQYELALNKEAEVSLQDREYMLYYVRVKPATADLKISYTVTKNGESTAVTEVEATEDPGFVMIGNMDTELVKYMYQLNKELNEVLNSCTTYEELVAVVAEISALLSTDPEVDLDDDFTFVKLADCIANGVIAGDLDTLHEYVIAATSTEIVKHENVLGEELNWEDPISGYDEVYVYYDSLYSIYYQWMKQYGFLPK